MLSQVHVALDNFSISTLFTFIGVLSTTITFVFALDDVILHCGVRASMSRSVGVR